MHRKTIASFFEEIKKVQATQQASQIDRCYYHRDLRLGVDPLLLVRSMSDKASQKEAHIRAVSYFNTMPQFNFKKQPALYATCKDDVWSYEEEYRLFLSKGGSLLSSGLYSFDPNALKSIIFGCRASDECIGFIKSITKSFSDVNYYKASREPNRFGIK